jgi:TPR repeat protein
MSKATINSRSSTVARCLTGVLVVFLNFGAVAIAGDLADGAAAYNQLDSATAWRLLQPLADRGDAGAQALIGNMYARGLGVTYDGAEAVRWWRMAAEQGDADAQEELATAYFWGDGVGQDHSEAAKWFGKAAERGAIFAQISLASLYERGEGVPKDLTLARMWLNLAAAQGQRVAQTELERLASKMTSGQVIEAQRLARGWKARK